MSFKVLFPLLAACLPLAAAADTAASFVPKPGLYRVDTDATMVAAPMTQHPVSIETRQDGRTGDQVFRQRAGGQTAQQAYKGDGPQTVCIGKGRDASALVAIKASGACVAGKGVIAGNSMTFTQSCPSLELKMTIKKIDADSYETHTQTRQKAGGQADAMLASIGQMKTMLENAKENAPTAAERKKAGEQLADFERYKTEMTRQAEQVKAIQPDIEKMKEDARREGVPVPVDDTTWVTSAIQKWTRIAAACDVPKAK